MAGQMVALEPMHDVLEVVVWIEIQRVVSTKMERCADGAVNLQDSLYAE